MSDSNSTYKLTVEVNTHEQHVASETQYGVRWPDGDITWGVINGDANWGKRIYLSDVVRKEFKRDEIKEISPYSVENWNRLTRERSMAAKLDEKAYLEMHTFVHRTLMLSATAPAEVK